MSYCSQHTFLHEKKITKIFYSSGKWSKNKIFLKSQFFELLGAFHSILMAIAETNHRTLLCKREQSHIYLAVLAFTQQCITVLDMIYECVSAITINVE